MCILDFEPYHLVALMDPKALQTSTMGCQETMDDQGEGLSVVLRDLCWLPLRSRENVAPSSK